MAFVFLYVTAPPKNATFIVKTLLKQRLIACANIFPVQSIYRWQQKIRQEREVVLILKTTTKKSVMAQKVLEKIHPYKIPCVTRICVQPNEQYATWLLEQL